MSDPDMAVEQPVKRFHIGDLLSVVTERLVSPSHLDGVYAVVDWMTDVPHFTHQLSRAGDVCKPHLLRQHPWLAAITIPESINDEATLRTFLGMVSVRYGEYHEVQRIPEGEYVAQNPFTEMAQMMTGQAPTTHRED